MGVRNDKERMSIMPSEADSALDRLVREMYQSASPKAKSREMQRLLRGGAVLHTLGMLDLMVAIAQAHEHGVIDDVKAAMTALFAGGAGVSAGSAAVSGAPLQCQPGDGRADTSGAASVAPLAAAEGTQGGVLQDLDERSLSGEAGIEPESAAVVQPVVSAPPKRVMPSGSFKGMMSGAGG